MGDPYDYGLPGSSYVNMTPSRNTGAAASPPLPTEIEEKPHGPHRLCANQEKTPLPHRSIVLVALLVLEVFDYYAAQLLNGPVTILFVLALINAALIVNYYMHISTCFRQKETTNGADTHAHPAGGISPAKRLHMNRMGLWLFLLSEAFLFGGILISRFYLWGDTRPHLDQTLGLAVTAMLLVSSFFANRAEVAIKHDDRGEFLRSIGITIVLGIVFLVGVVGLEWRTAPVNPATEGEFGIYGDVLFFMTGMHAFHVLTGVILLLIMAYLGYKGHFTPEISWALRQRSSTGTSWMWSGCFSTPPSI